ncbi:MAG TPA: hypothetical protein VHG29_05730 [Novosphingobium sp.]|nr:hypothetical protein [Novosphingobium sp.]
MARPAAAQAASACEAQEGDVAGCQPAPFDAPLGQMPTRRINENGVMDRTASDAATRQGATSLEKRLKLFRNFERIHWIEVDPSETDPKTGIKSGGSLDGDGDGRGLTISGQCMFAGHRNAPQSKIDAGPMGSATTSPAAGARPMDEARNHGISIFRLQEDPAHKPPVLVGRIAPPLGPGYDDTLLSAAMIPGPDGKDQIILMRDMSGLSSGRDGRMYVYTVDPQDCQVRATSEGVAFGSDFHEPSAWVDPKNPKRMLIVATTMSQDNELAFLGRATLRPGEGPGNAGYPDLRVFAITDERTGEMLKTPLNLANFRLQDVGGPVTDDRPDDSGLFSDGRFADWSDVKASDGNTVSKTTNEGNGIHQATMSDTGERIYVAGGTAGFYILNSAAIARHSNAEIASGAAKCNRNSTNIYVDDVVGSSIDQAKLRQVANDCVHMVVNDDPGVKALIDAGAFGRYLAIQDRSRWDPYPPRPVHTGTHSAIPVPGRPTLDKFGAGGPSLVFLTEERFDCPYGHAFLVQTDSEATPQIAGTFGLPINVLNNCLKLNPNEPDGTPRRTRVYFSHAPTLFENLAFVSWYAQGIRAIDISNPANMREVGHAVPIPMGGARSYPIYKDGLFYWMDFNTGIHVVRYTGPRAEELPTDHLVYEGNSVPHR